MFKNRFSRRNVMTRRVYVMYYYSHRIFYRAETT
jgi:hypothetical protein